MPRPRPIIVPGGIQTDLQQTTANIDLSGLFSHFKKKKEEKEKEVAFKILAEKLLNKQSTQGAAAFEGAGLTIPPGEGRGDLEVFGPHGEVKSVDPREGFHIPSVFVTPIDETGRAQRPVRPESNIIDNPVTDEDVSLMKSLATLNPALLGKEVLAKTLGRKETKTLSEVQGGIIQDMLDGTADPKALAAFAFSKRMSAGEKRANAKAAKDGVQDYLEGEGVEVDESMKKAIAAIPKEMIPFIMMLLGGANKKGALSDEDAEFEALEGEFGK